MQQQFYLECLRPRFLCVFSFVTKKYLFRFIGDLNSSQKTVRLQPLYLQINLRCQETLFAPSKILLQEWSGEDRSSQVGGESVLVYDHLCSVSGDYRPGWPLIKHTSFSQMHPGPNFVFETQKMKTLIELQEL